MYSRSRDQGDSTGGEEQENTAEGYRGDHAQGPRSGNEQPVDQAPEPPGDEEQQDPGRLHTAAAAREDAIENRPPRKNEEHHETEKHAPDDTERSQATQKCADEFHFALLRRETYVSAPVRSSRRDPEGDSARRSRAGRGRALESFDFDG